MTLQRLRFFLACGFVLVVIYPALSSRQSDFAKGKVQMAESGKAALPIVVPEKTSEHVRQSAATLAAYLERISGAKFQVTTGDGSAGIAIGRAEDFPVLPYAKLWDTRDLTLHEDYLLRSHAKGLHIVGASDQAVRHGVWDFLHRLGYRQYFPGATWEVVPKSMSLAIDVDAKEHPSYYSRRIWYGFGTWDYNGKPYAEWCERNRATGGIVLRTGHAYPGIVSRNKAEFAAHPEYKGLVDGQRKGNQFCVGNTDLRKLVVADALKQMQNDLAAQSISLEPADGGGWCQCDKCKAIGPPSDRALLLANEVAEAINAKFGPRYVGMYAYSQHSPPPSIQVHPKVIISVATAFIRGGFSVDQLLTGWQKKGATLGIREYYSVHTWDRDLPGSARGSNINYLKKTIPDFHSKGARFLSAESSDNWGPNGLGYYLSARMMWNVNDAKRVDELVADFLDKSFGPAKEPMSAYYKLIDGSKKPLLSDDLVGRMYRLLADAEKLANDPAITARIDDLILYTRYVELWLDYATAAGAARQQGFENLVRHAYRMRKTMLVHTKALYRDLPNRDKSLTVPKEAAWNVPEKKNPWKSSAPFSRDELLTLVSQGIETRKLLDFQPIAFSDNLVPADKLKLTDGKPGVMGIYSRGQRTYHTWVAKEPASLTFKATGGRVYTDKGPVKVDLYPANEPEGKSVAHIEVPADKKEHDVELKTTFTGLHRVTILDGSAGTALAWTDGVPMTLASSPEQPATLAGRWSLYFYVPKGTKVIGGFSKGVGQLLDANGKSAHTFTAAPTYFSIPVPAGQDGKLWKFQQSTGQRLLMTVPPYLARSARELLLPAEVVEKDAAK